MSRLLLWLTLYPTSWRRLMAQLDLSAYVCLLEIRQWRNPLLLRLLTIGYVVQPLGALLLVLGWTIVFGRNPTWTTIGFLLGWVIGLIVGIWINLASGLLISTVVAVVAAVGWSEGNIVIIDVMQSTRMAWLFGLSSALILHVTRLIGVGSAEISLRRQVGGIVLGLLMSVIVMVVTVAALLGLVSVAHDGGINRNIIRWVIGGVPALLFAIAGIWRTRRFVLPLLFGVVVLLVQVGLFGETGYQYDAQPNGNALMMSLISISYSIYFILIILPYNLTERFITPMAAAITGTLGGLITIPALWQNVNLLDLDSNLLLVIGLFACGLVSKWLWSVVAYPLLSAWNTLLYRLDLLRPLAQGTRISYHSFHWDELQHLRLWGLDEHMLLAIERGVDRQMLLASVSDSLQAWAARATQVELDARSLECCTTIEQVGNLHTTMGSGFLSSPASMIQFYFKQLSEDVAAAIAQPTLFNRRLVLQTVATQLGAFSAELVRSEDVYAGRFRPIVIQWQHLVATTVEALTAQSLANQEIPNPYIIGVPLTRRQAVFVGRTNISSRIEGILRRDDFPPLLLYGQRRMGKTSLLYQLRWLLPSNIASLVVDLQGPIALATSHGSFLFNLARAMQQSAERQHLNSPPLDRHLLEDDPFTLFDLWLEQFELLLKQQGRDTILVALDEFESLDYAFEHNTLDPDAVLGMFRHVVQHHPSIKLLFSGSHAIEKFHRWSSYLINAQTIHISFLSRQETEQLIFRPIPDYPLQYERAAVERTWALTVGHPYLTQLLCMELVSFKNEQAPGKRLLATESDIEHIIVPILERGQQFFVDLERNQLSPLERDVLRQLATNGIGKKHATGAQSDSARHDALQSNSRGLIQRGLLIDEDESIQFRSGLIEAWFAHESYVVEA